MNRDELKEKIKAIIIEAREEDHHGNLLMYSDEATDLILFLLAPEFTDAEKWRKVKEIAKMFDIKGCEGCPMINTNYHICGNAWCVVNALEGEGEKG